MKTNALRAFWTVVRKELRDLLRDRRTILVTSMSVVLSPVLLLGLSMLAEQRARTQTDRVLQVPVIGAERAPNLVAFLATYSIVAVKPPADVDRAIREQRIDVALRIDDAFAERWTQGQPAPVEIILDSTRRDADIPSQRVEFALAAYSQQVGALRLLARGIAPTVARPVNVGRRDLATAEAKRGILLSFMLPYMLMLLTFVGGSAYLIIDATAGERERQSLEPLLATPIGRGTLVSGKIAAACTVGLISLALTLLAFRLCGHMSTGVGRLFDVSFPAMGRILVILTPLLFLGATLLTLLSASAKSTKEAQSHMAWLFLLPVIPSMVLAVNPLKTQLWQFAVPFLSQNQLLLKVIRGEAIEAQTWLVYLAASIGIAALLWLASVWRYHSEQLAISG